MIKISGINRKDITGYTVASKREQQWLASRIREFIHSQDFDADIKI